MAKYAMHRVLIQEDVDTFTRPDIDEETGLPEDDVGVLPAGHQIDRLEIRIEAETDDADITVEGPLLLEDFDGEFGLLEVLVPDGQTLSFSNRVKFQVDCPVEASAVCLSGGTFSGNVSAWVTPVKTVG